MKLAEVLVAVQHSGSALQHAAEALQSDQEVASQLHALDFLHANVDLLSFFIQVWREESIVPCGLSPIGGT